MCPGPPLCPGRPRTRGRFPYEEAAVLGAENSEVLLAGFVAVVVTVRPRPTFWAGEKAKVTLLLPVELAADRIRVGRSPATGGLQKVSTCWWPARGFSIASSALKASYSANSRSISARSVWNARSLDPSRNRRMSSLHR